jgi:flagellar hook-basal body complex protein FliE
MDYTDLSISGYYLRPSLAYKATTLFGGDEALNSLVEGGGQPQQSFADALRDGLAQVNALQLASDDLATRFAAGETDNIHEVMIAGEKASVALQLASAIRGKVMDAYQEIMRMQI